MEEATTFEFPMFRKLIHCTLFALLLSGPAVLHAQAVGQLPQMQSAAPAQKPLTPLQKFQGYEDKWSIAVVNADQFTLQNLLAPDFVNISPHGQTTIRSQQIVDLFQKARRPVSMEQKVLSVRIFGDTALVRGDYMMKWDNNGRTRVQHGVFTHVYVLTRDRWRCVSSQRSAIPNPAPPPRKSRSRHRRR
jgi:ketosteroid isomerase-like protein